MADQNLDAFIPLPAVKIATGLSRATIYEWMSRGTFPMPFKLGRATRWSTKEVQEWIEAQRVKRDAGQMPLSKRPWIR